MRKTSIWLSINVSGTASMTGDDTAHKMESISSRNLYCCCQYFTENSPVGAERKAIYATMQCREILFHITTLKGLIIKIPIHTPKPSKTHFGMHSC
jgi:hypothetical protein